MWRLVLLELGLLVVACSRSAPSQPRPIDRLATARDKHDSLAAYVLMPEEFRWVYSRSDFVRMMGGELVTPALAPSPTPVAPPLDRVANTTPREALRSFVRAWQHKRWDLVLALVPNEYRTVLNVDTIRERLERPESADILRMLVDGIANPIDEHDERATMPYGGKFQVVFVHEPEGWKIQDLD
jgi:hypothetical protein